MKTNHKLPLILALGAMFSPLAMAQDMPKPANAVTLVDGLEGVFGTQAGFRRSGAKGICAQGEFVGTAEAANLSTASAFNGKAIPVTLRFSVGGGNPKAPDTGKSVRGLAAQFKLPNGEEWLMANISAPFFTAATPEGFLAFLEARRPDPATGKPNPDKIAAAAAQYPDFKPQADWLKNTGVPASYATVNYWSAHAFKFVNKKGQTQFAKWMFEPVTGQEFIPDDQIATKPANFLADELRQRVAAKPAEFVLKLQLAQAGDVTDNATIAWPADRKTVVAGRLTVKSVESEGSASCDGINFNPLVLPKGIEPSADPLLPARAGSYAVSQQRRLTK